MGPDQGHGAHPVADQQEAGSSHGRFDEEILAGMAGPGPRTIHDQFQFECSIDYDRQPPAGETERRYDVDCYLFLPVNMEINSDSYPQARFYNQLTNYLRIRTPEFSRWRDGEAHDLTLPAADRYFEAHRSSQNRLKLAGLVVQEIKFFGCFIDTQLHDLQTQSLHALDNGTALPGPTNWPALENHLIRLEAIIRTYRSRYVERAKSQSIFLEDEVKSAFLLVDEYISYQLESVLIHICQIVEGCHQDIEGISNSIHRLLVREVNYRRTADLPVLEQVHKQSEHLENHYYRLGLLKQYVHQVLYLETENINRERVYANIIGACGAALAGLWAALANVQPSVQIVGSQAYGLSYAGKDTGFRIILLILVAALAYVFKDRIKDLTKEYFNKKLKHHLPDWDVRIHYTHFDEKGEGRREFVGSCQEFIRYLSQEAVPPEILYIRTMGHRSEWDPQHNDVVIHYSRKIAFKPDSKRNGFAPSRHIKNVLRFDLSEFLKKLDDPARVLQYFDREKGIETAEVPKVYHLNVLFRYAIGLGGRGAEQRWRCEYEHIRVVLNRKGIMRLEEVLPRGGLRDWDSD